MSSVQGGSGDASGSSATSNPVADAAARYRCIVETLPDEYHKLFLSCCDGDVLLDGVKALEVLKDKKVVRHLGRIQSFVRSFQPMFAAMDVLSQVDPIHFATVWGGVRVLVQLTSNFLNFYDKLTQSLYEMSRAIDYFRAVHVHNLVSGSKTLEVLLGNVFAEVLDFLTGVMRIFHTSEGKVKSRARTYASAAFKPFRFGQTIEHMEEYRKAVVAELVLQQSVKLEHISTYLAREDGPDTIKVGRRPFRNLGPEINEALIDRIRSWLAPTSYASRYQDARDIRKGSTAGWVFEQSAYQNWRAIQFKSATLWIHGKPGSGKTVLAAALVDHEKTTSPTETPYYFFFDSLQAATSSSTTAYRAILSQILQKHSANVQLIDMISFSMYFTSDGQPTLSEVESGDLLELCLQLPELQDSMLILDGLDECEDAAKDLVVRLKRLSLQTHIKTIMLGRSSIQGVLKGLPDLISLHVGSLNLDDIQLYLRGELDAAMDNELLPRSLDLDDIVDKLSRRADGMFLWARLMMAYLNSPGLLVSERFEAISDIGMPEGLERMYERILRQMAKAGKTTLRLACHVFMCLMYARRELTLSELEDSVVSRKKGGIDEPSRNIPNFSDSVLSVCGGFVEQHRLALQGGEIIAQPSFRFIHASVKEYFRTEPQRKTDGEAVLKDAILVPLPLAGNSRLATQSLEYVVYALPKGRIESSSTPKEELLTIRPLSQYVTINWPDHVLATNGDKTAVQEVYVQEPMVYAEFISALCQILSSPGSISSWVQSCYIFQHEPPFQTLLQWAGECSRPDFPWRKHFLQIDDIAPEMKRLAVYLRKVVAEWGPHLWRDPSCIWEEVGAFAPSPFILSPRGFSVRKLVSSEPAATLSREPIHKVSRLMPDGKLDYLLSVFPTEEFVESSSQLAIDWGSDCSKCLKYSTGWIARLEVFSIEDCHQAACLEIPLEQEEVRLQIYQTMMCSSSGGSLQVPLSLSPDGQCFTVLRTLYRLHGEIGALSYTAHNIPLEVNNSNNKFWQTPNVIPWRPDPRRLYLYWIYFDDRGRYLCFVEQTPSKPHSFSVFDFGERRNTTLTFVAQHDVSLPRPQDHYYPGRDRREFELAFHPYLPTMALAGLSGAFLWDFAPGHAHNGFVKLDPDGEEGKGKVEMLSFSSDGNSCIMKTRGHLPTIYNVGKQLPSLTWPRHESLLLLDEFGPVAGSVAQGSRQTIAVSESSSLIVSSDTLGTIRAGSRAMTVQGKLAGELVLGNTRGEVSLSRWSDSAGNNLQSITLTRIPNLPGSRDIIPGVILPSIPDDPVKIVLDKGPTTSNRINKASQEQTIYPTVVERHISSIQRSHQAQRQGLPGNESFFAISEGGAAEEDIPHQPVAVPSQNQSNLEIYSNGRPIDFDSSEPQTVGDVERTSLDLYDDDFTNTLNASTSITPPEQFDDGGTKLPNLYGTKKKASKKKSGSKRGWSLKKLWRKMH